MLTPTPPTPLLILDIDGTVRHGADDVRPDGRERVWVNGPDDVIVFPEARRQMLEWSALGGRIVGVSNQAGVALGIYSRADCLLAMAVTNRQAGSLFDEMLMCTHHPEDPCWCRKPAPGLVLQAVARLEGRYPREHYTAAASLFVGDRAEDRECAERINVPFKWAATWRRGGE